MPLNIYLQACEQETDLYLFDQPLSQRCPAVVEELMYDAHQTYRPSGLTVGRVREPAFVQDNLLQGTASAGLWPSLFVGKSTVHAELHVDAWCSHFYMKMLHGRKRSAATERLR